MRILYLSEHFAFPAGGVRVAHRHVSTLVKHGYNAAVLLTRGETDKSKFFETDVPVFSVERGFQGSGEDIVVVPEGWYDYLVQLQRTAARTIVFCQNHFYVYAGLRAARDYAEFGVEDVFCSSDIIANYLRTVLKIKNPWIVHNVIDRTVFRPRTKKRQIACMPRKMRHVATFIRESLGRVYPTLANVPWVEIDKMPEAEVAQILGESEVFLSLGRLEGHGLPPLEAMACGALVVGFDGEGGREYASSENGVWCAAEDWRACVDGLHLALTELSENSERGRAMRAAGLATAARYSQERMARELTGYWAKVTSATGKRPRRRN